MTLQKKRLQLYRNTVWAIAASKYVHTFYIGFTSRSAFQCFGWYRKKGCEHMVLLADRLTEKDAKGLEEYLQCECRKADKRIALRRKAHKKNILNSRYYLGAMSRTPKEKVHSVYMVWWEPD
jgi:hypothetical protein